MQSKELFEKFLEFEVREKLFERTYRGVHYWHLLRFEIYEKAAKKSTAATHPDTVFKSRWDSYGRIIRGRLHTLRTQKCPQGDLYIISGYRPVYADGKFYQPFVSDVAQMQNFHTHVHYVCGPYNIGMAEGENVSDNAVLLWRRLWLRPYGQMLFSRELREESAYFCALLQREFGFCWSEHYAKKRIAFLVAQFKYTVRYYKNILKRGGFRCAYVVCHYGFDMQALIQACHELGIPVVEQQHGTIGSQHIAYNFEDLRPIGKYLPDKLFTFGDYWTKTCRLPKNVERLSMGSGFLDAEKLRLVGRVRNEKAVVFYSQGPIGDKLSRLALDFAVLAVKRGYKVLYKLHPNERLSWRRIYPWLEGQEVMEIADQPVSVYEFMTQARFHVGVCSTSLFEALAFSGTVFVADLPGSEYMDDMVDMGFAVRFTNAAELLTLIEGCEQANKGDTDEIGKKLYLPGTAQRLEDMLCKLIREGK